MDFDLLRSTLSFQKLQFNRLLEITQAINNNISVTDLASLYKSTLTWTMKVGRFALFIQDDGVWRCLCAAEDEANELDEIGFDPAAFIAQNPRSVRFEISDPLAQLGFDLMVPVLHKRYPVAFALLEDIESSREELAYEPIQFVVAITNIVVVAIENKRLFKRQLEQERLRSELDLAVQVQNRLLPNDLPKNERYEFSGIYQPHEGVGGDYYDFIPLGEDEFAFCIADVSGKGIAAALLMSSFQANLHAQIHHSTANVKDFTQQLNRAILRTTRGEKFITFFLARYNRQTRQLRYLCAGHNPPVMVYQNQLHRLDKGCTILGIFDRIPKIEMGQLTLESDALFCLYTDGLTDLVNDDNEFFGDSRLEAFALEHQHLDVLKFNQTLYDQIVAFKGKQPFPDDISVLTGRIFV